MPADRPDPVALLIEQGETRVADLVPIRYGRMLVSPFTFLRGAALVMAADLARLPSSGIYVQSCGDAHLSNFGVFATPERRLSFDVNDFDETHPAPFEWDVKRLATSIVVAGLGAGYERATVRTITRATAGAYRTEMRSLAAMSFLDAWYTWIDVTAMLAEVEQRGSARTKKIARRAVEKASTRTNLGTLSSLAEHTDAGWRIRANPPLIVRYDATPERDAALRDGFTAYRRSLGRDMQPIIDAYRYADYARKVVGVGSIGTEAFVILNIGQRNNDGERVVVAGPVRRAGATFLGWKAPRRLSRSTNLAGSTPAASAIAGSSARPKTSIALTVATRMRTNARALLQAGDQSRSRWGQSGRGRGPHPAESTSSCPGRRRSDACPPTRASEDSAMVGQVVVRLSGLGSVPCPVTP